MRSGGDARGFEPPAVLAPAAPLDLASVTGPRPEQPRPAVVRVGDVREPLTTFAELGDEGRERLGSVLPLIAEFDRVLESAAGTPSAA